MYLFYAIDTQENPITIKRLIERGYNPQAKDENNDSLLHRTIEKYQDDNRLIEVLKILIENKVDINSCNNARETPLMYAVCAHPTFKIISFLFDNGASIECTDLNNTAFSLRLHIMLLMILFYL